MTSKPVQNRWGAWRRVGRYRAFRQAPSMSIFGPLCWMPILLQALPLNSIHGTVMDEQGHAVARSMVSLKSMDSRVKRRCSCNAKGEFHFNRLPAGKYTILGEAPHYYEKFQVIGAMGFGGSNYLPITVPAASDAAIPLVMEPKSRLQGRLFLPDGRPFRNGSFVFTAPRPEAFTARFPVKTNHAGAFELEFRYEGVEFFEAVLPDIGYVPSTPFQLVEGKTIHQEFSVQHSASIAGQIYNKADGQPVSSAYIEVSYEDAGIEVNGTRYVGSFRLMNMSVIADDQGNFTIPNLPPGLFTMKVYFNAVQYHMYHDAETSFSVQLKAGERHTGVILGLSVTPG